MSFGMLMPSRNTRSNLQGGFSNGTTTVNGNTYVSNLTITTRIGNTPNTYKAATSIEFVGEYVDNGNEEYEAFIVNQTNPDPNPTTGTVSNGNNEGYRYGFNRQEKSDDVTAGNYTAEYWEYDSRIGRRWNLDPKPNPSISSYAAFANNPILLTDPLGDTTNYSVKKGDNLTKLSKQNNVSLDRLKQYNPQIKDFNKISIGQNINIPGTQNDKLMNGDFVAVVNAPNGAAGFGHNALMVGNDKTGWTFISKEGRQEGESATSGNNPFSGGPALPPKEGKFGTVQDLLDSKYFKEYKNVSAYTIQSTQAAPLITKMHNEAISKYALLSNNCGHACGNSISTVGLDPGNIWYRPTINRWGGKGNLRSLYPSEPNVQYNFQKENNSSRLVTEVNE
jgi:LysM repeat protein